jgi:hypothetical protein
MMIAKISNPRKALAAVGSRAVSRPFPGSGEEGVSFSGEARLSVMEYAPLEDKPSQVGVKSPRL